MVSSINASLIEQYGWHEWLCKSNFSFLLGASHPKELLTTAIEQRYSSLCLNDMDGVYGLARAYRELGYLRRDRQSHPPSLRLHYGAELHLSQDHHLPVLLQDTVVLVARNWSGYRTLCELLSYAHRGGKSAAFVPLDYVLSIDPSNLVAIQPMRGLIRRSLEAARQRYIMLREHFAGSFYCAISCHLHRTEDYWISITQSLARELDLPCLLSQDAFFHHPEAKDLSDVLHAIRTNRPLDRCEEHFFPNNERHLHSLRGIEARFRHLPLYEEALKNSRDLADSLSFCFSELRYRYPQEMIPAGFTAQSYLAHLTWKGAHARYGSVLSEKVRSQLQRELELIEELGFADYFLTVWDIVAWAREQQILCQGRGSAANSAVCFMLGITSVDPSLFDLLFERFISRERGDPPDIDVDFEHERREEVIQYIYRRYGRERAAMVANVITFRSKGSLRAVGKAFGLPEAVIRCVSGIYTRKFMRRSGAQRVIAQVQEELAAQGEDRDLLAENIPWQLWAELAERLRGFPRHLGIHSGGFVLSDQPIVALVAQEPATMEGRTVIQWCKDDIEGLGFFKIDVLALGMLTAIRKCFAYVDQCYGRRYEMSSIPHEDAATYAMIQRADTVGTFQIESRAQMSMLPRLRPETFYDLVIEVAIIRPGPIQGRVIHPYLRRRQGHEPVTYPDPRLEGILNRTLGVVIFQEQLMRVAMTIGNFTAGEADELRKMTGMWNAAGLVRNLEPMLAKLIQGMRDNGLSQDFIEQMIGQMRGFADYGFPESHAVSFALIAYASSYLKCHYPAAFFAAVLNSQPMGFYSPHALLQSAQRSGVEVLPICVNYSCWDTTLEPTKDAGIFALRLGLRLIHGLRQQAAENLVAQRSRIGGRFAGFQQLLGVCNLYRPDLTALAAANALQIFGYTRKDALWLAEAAPLCPHLEDVEEPLSWSVEDNMERTTRDFAAFSTTLGPHPCTIIRLEQWRYALPIARLTLAKDLLRQRGRQVAVFGMVLVKQAPPSAKGMVFFTLEDETGFINVVFTPPLYKQFAAVVEASSFLCVHGVLQRAGEYASVRVQRVYPRIEQQATIIPLVREQASHAEEVLLLQPRSYI